MAVLLSQPQSRTLTR